MEQPDWFNAPVPSLRGPMPSALLIVGLAPGLRGANRTGRPFTGDYAGELLYATLKLFGLASGEFRANPADSLQLVGTTITNAVRCVPPQNKPTPVEIRTCRRFFEATLEQMEHLQAIVALGRVAHETVLRTFSQPLARFPFQHGASHLIEHPRGTKVMLFNSYHCSRYNTNTGVLTTQMFEQVFASVRIFLDTKVNGT